MKKQIIKWLRLQALCVELIKKKTDRDVRVFLHASTDLPDDCRAMATIENDEADILLNMEYNKSLGEIISSIAHEVTHLILGNNAHSKNFNETRAWAEEFLTFGHEEAK